MKKKIPLNFEFTVLSKHQQKVVALGILLLVFLSSCSKKATLEPTPPSTPVVTTVINQPVSQPYIDPYSVVDNTKITLSNYNFSHTNKSPNNAVGKIYPSTLVNSFSFSAQDSAYVYLKNDSLCLTAAGKTKLLAESSLDFYVRIDDGSKGKKPIRILLDQFLTNKVIAHRGAYLKLGLPENSLASLRQAFALGCQGSEFDVHLTADKKIIVCHDDTYAGLTIETSTLAQLSAIKLSNGESLPLLQDFLLEAMKQKKTRLDLEIKPSIVSIARGNELADSVAILVHRLKAQAWIHYTSFSSNQLKEILVNDPTAKVEYLNGDLTIAQLKAAGFFGLDYTYSYYQPGASIVTAAHALELYTSAWTIDDKTQMADLLSKNVDAILTNYPELLFTLIK